MKTIGVLGGIGPQATMDFELRLHRAAQRIIPPQGNSGYPPMVVYYHRRPPFVIGDDMMPVFPILPDPELLKAAHRLGAIADFLVITANGPHLILGQIEQAAGRKVLSMVDTALEEVQRRRWKRVGVLGFGDPRVTVYTERFADLGLEYEIIDADKQAGVNAAVRSVIEGTETAASAESVRRAVTALRAHAVDGIILGCTELPLVLGEFAESPDLLNPAEHLAEAAVRLALQE